MPFGNEIYLSKYSLSCIFRIQYIGLWGSISKTLGRVCEKNRDKQTERQTDRGYTFVILYYVYFFHQTHLVSEQGSTPVWCMILGLMGILCSFESTFLKTVLAFWHRTQVLIASITSAAMLRHQYLCIIRSITLSLPT